MIAFIRGTVASYGADWAVIENHGMGWKVFYPHTEQLRLSQEVTVYTYMHISENDAALYGFASPEEQDLFLKLINVKGLGPKTAVTMLSRSSMEHLVTSIEQGDVAALKSIPGIGAKTASQIILDLKGKLVESADKSLKLSPEIEDALEALKNLGYKQGELNQAAKAMSEQKGLRADEYLKFGLQYLMKKKVGG
ncbi:MAG: Holliday junction branch migration protein RuvA [Solobacterium sp.]|nr:Holliday junction branch migration protein RuvA [Solobacterium sp.]